MSKKIRVIDSGREKLVSADFLLSRELRKREIFTVDLSLRQNKIIVLVEYPIALSETIYINGIYQTAGIDYDYTIDMKTITFNTLVIPNNGHITINYKYLNSGV